MPEPQFEAAQPPEQLLIIDSMVGSRTGVPSVMLSLGDRTSYLSPVEAREVAFELLKEAVYAEMDGCVFRWGTEKIEQSREDAAKLVVMYREKRREEPPSCTMNLHGERVRPRNARNLARFLMGIAAYTEAEAFLVALLVEAEQSEGVINGVIQDLRDIRTAVLVNPDDIDLPTTERLARAMEAAGCPAEMIERARVGHYDDFKSALATPLIVLVNDLREIGQEELAARVVNGEFDATPQESAAWFEREGKQLLPESMWAMFQDPPEKKRQRGRGFGRKD